MGDLEAAMQAHIDSIKDAPDPSPRLISENSRNCLTTWFPILVKAGLPVPKTAIVDAGDDWHKMLGIADGPTQFPKEHGEAMAIVDRVAEGIRGQASFVGGYPLFLRTSHFSGKHNWNKTCFVPDADSVLGHVCELVVTSEMFGMMGELPWRYWAVREMLPTDAIAKLPAYGDFPLVREVRAFVGGGKILCRHPYWISGSLRQGFSLRKCPDPWVSRVVQGAVFVQELIASLQGFFGSGPDRSLDKAESWMANKPLLSPGISVGDDLFSQLNQRFGLTLLDPQIRKHEATCVGGFHCTDGPVVQRLSSLAGWRNGTRLRAAKHLFDEIDSNPLNLLDLDFGSKGVADSVPGRLLQVDGETAIGVEDSGAVCKSLSVVFHKLHDTNSTGEDIVVMTLIPDNWLPQGFTAEVADADSVPVDPELGCLLTQAAQAFLELGGSWSVDVLKTRRGWFVTDCAVAQRSFHYPGCEVKFT